MLDSEVIRKIEDFVYPKPRSIDEISKHIEKNWRTADRYIGEIEKNFGTISTRVFREGTRGALKVAYWSSVDKISNSIFQERLESEIINSRRKDDFSAFDIFQFVNKKNKKLTVENSSKEEETNLKELAEIINKTEKQLLVFSGNLSFINLKNKNVDIFKILEDLVKKGVIIKVICRVDVSGRENIEKLLSLNFKYGKELIEIRHKEHPIRSLIVDKNLFRIKEIKEPTGRIKELDKKLFIFYTITDKEWTEWLSKIFWKMFNNSISAEKRIGEMRLIRTD